MTGLASLPAEAPDPGAAQPAGPSPVTHAEPAMGTVFSFAVVAGAVPGSAVRAAIARADQENPA